RVFRQGKFNYSIDCAVSLDAFTLLASQFGKSLPATADLPRSSGDAINAPMAVNPTPTSPFAVPQHGGLNGADSDDRFLSEMLI
ncbi:MAG TPA: hypothetical protein PLD59_14070, partial [Tepidisphaeraceae bacterium]|nr:hypothetical protein [Tepidisphaeraceae bacterium]